MKKRAMLAAVACGLCASSLHAQMRERVDPVTGNYVPVRDPFLNDDPDPDKPNPNRLSNRLSKRNSSSTAPAASAPRVIEGELGDGLTPAQRAARYAANNAQAAPLISAISGLSTPQISADGFISMGGMETYTPPGSEQNYTRAFAMPEWWPR